MKIAAITDDGKTISQHFGRATHYLVLTIEYGKVTNQELREKLNHAQLSNEPHGHEQMGQQHGFSPASQQRHARMVQPITDCEVLLSRGMGRGAYENIKSYGIQPILTDIATIDEAVRAYIEGQIVDHPERLH